MIVTASVGVSLEMRYDVDMETSTHHRRLQADLEMRQVRDRFSNRVKDITRNYNQDVEKLRMQRSQTLAEIREKMENKLDELHKEKKQKLQEKDVEFQKDIEKMQKLRDQKMKTAEREQHQKMREIRQKYIRLEQQKTQDHLESLKNQHETKKSVL